MGTQKFIFVINNHHFIFKSLSKQFITLRRNNENLD